MRFSGVRSACIGFAFIRSPSLGSLWEQVTGEEKGFAEMAGYDFIFVADGGEVDAGIPALQ